MNSPNQNFLKSILHYDPCTGLFTHKTQRGGVKKGSLAGNKNKSNYVVIRINHKAYRAHRLAWLYTYGMWPTGMLDHINNDRSDNSIYNLREASNSENNQNKNLAKNNLCGIKGVFWNKHKRRWEASCSLNGKRYVLGRFKNISDAEREVRLFREKAHGEFANHGDKKGGDHAY
ncbi:HNH endonuclease [Rosenbergiella australiborealis]|uniref:HNH endonuclease n=1 Tax=Rosenbergiella australiborealis TaxID=1544696 RepID=UPI001F4EB585|nr:HNH endonuclease [Rosenbergiella australiborealis]